MSDHSAVLGGASIVANLQTVCAYAAQGGANNRTTSVLHFADGHWQGTLTLQAPIDCEKTNKPGRDDETRLWSWDPQPDGTLKGLQVGTILSDGCGTQGTVYRTPFVATRTGDVAPNVIVADPALFEAPTAPASPPPRAGR
jgi:hypothetical protein